MLRSPDDIVIDGVPLSMQIGDRRVTNRQTWGGRQREKPDLTAWLPIACGKQRGPRPVESLPTRNRTIPQNSARINPNPLHHKEKAMDGKPLEWAERNLALVLAIIDANPATPTGHEKEAA